MTKTEMRVAATTLATKWPHQWQQPQQPTTMTATTSDILVACFLETGLHHFFREMLF
jgi:hypothetical protein